MQLYISRLAAVEYRSALAKKVRSNQLTETAYQHLCILFEADIAQRIIRVGRVRESHFQRASTLIEKYALTQNLRTLDAIQLSVALSGHQWPRSSERIQFELRYHFWCLLWLVWMCAALIKPLRFAIRRHSITRSQPASRNGSQQTSGSQFITDREVKQTEWRSEMENGLARSADSVIHSLSNRIGSGKFSPVFDRFG